MKITKMAVIALLATGSTIAIAQAASAGNTAATNSSATPSLMQKVTDSLEQSGLNNVQVMPGSFVVHATDKAGDPISMYITPDSMTAVSDVAFTDGNAADNSTVDDANGGASGVTQVASFSHSGNSANSDSAASDFSSIPSRDELGTQVIGLDVHNSANKSIGSIKDIALDQNGQVNGYILSVGGFLGIDEHDVAVRPSAINLTRSNDKKWHAEMNVNAAQLKAAPEYKYSS